MTYGNAKNVVSDDSKTVTIQGLIEFKVGRANVREKSTINERIHEIRKTLNIPNLSKISIISNKRNYVLKGYNSQSNCLFE